MKSKIDALIPFAVEAVREKLTDKKNPLKVEKGYNGAIASFGTGLHHAGVLATVAMFSNAQAQGDVDKSKLLDAIFFVLQKRRSGIQEKTLFAFLLQNEAQLPRLKKELTDIAISLKLAIRTFDLS
jgi:hypothetical protein